MIQLSIHQGFPCPLSLNVLLGWKSCWSFLKQSQNRVVYSSTQIYIHPGIYLSGLKMCTEGEVYDQVQLSYLCHEVPTSTWWRYWLLNGLDIGKMKYFCCDGSQTRGFPENCGAIAVFCIELYCIILVCLKPATGRPYVRAFSLSGTVPAFTCDCLRFVCAFTPRPKVDLCVSTAPFTYGPVQASQAWHRAWLGAWPRYAPVYTIGAGHRANSIINMAALNLRHVVRVLIAFLQFWRCHRASLQQLRK